MTKPLAHISPVTSWVTRRKAAAHIGVTEAELSRDRRRDQPEIPFVLIGGKIRYSERELDAFLDRVRGEGRQ